MSQEIFQQLYQDYHRLVRQIGFRIQGETGLDDFVQEVFLKIWQNLARFEKRASWKTWIYRIATNAAIDRLKKRKVVEVEYQETTMGNTPDAPVDLEASQALKKGLLRLSPEQRALILVYYYEGLSLAEMAEVFEVPEGTVKSRLYHTRQELLGYFESQGLLK